jgi:hypothetical protein
MGLAKWAGAAAVVVSFSASVLGQEAGPIEMPAKVQQMAVSPSSGVVAVVEVGRNGLVLYPKLSSEKTLEGGLLSSINGQPIALCHKPQRGGGVFIVADNQQTIYVMDDVSGKVLGKVKVEGDVMDVAAAQNAEEKIVYYTITKGRGHHGGGKVVGRVDVSAMKDEGFFDTPQQFGDRYIIEAASDGRTIYLTRPDTSPTGIYAMRWSEAEPNQLVKVHDQHDSMWGYTPLPQGLGVAMKNEIRTLDLSTKIRELRGPMLAAMSTKPVIFCDSGNKVVAVSLNTGRELSSVSLDAASGQPETPYEKKRREMQSRPGARPQPQRVAPGRKALNLRRFKATAFVDDKNKNLVLIKEGGVSVVGLAQFELPNEPLLAVKVKGATDLSAYEPWKASVVPMDKGVSVSLGSAPAGVKLEGNQLTWTPPAESVGTTRVKLKLSSGLINTEQQIELTVRQKAIKLPFWVGGFAATPDGKKVVVISAEGRNHRPDDGTRTSRVAVIDLGTSAVLFTEQLDFRAAAVAASNETIYLAAQQTDAVYSMNFAKPAEVRKTFMDGQAMGLDVVGRRLYALVQKRHGGAGLMTYQLPSMEPLESVVPAGLAAMVHHDGGSALPQDVGGAWRVGEAVWSADLSKALALLEPTGLPGVSLRAGGPLQNRMARWGSAVENTQIRRVSGQVIDQNHDSLGGTILVDLPAAALLRAAMQQDEGRMNVMQLELGIFDLVDGKQEKVVLMREPWDHTRGSFDDLRFGRRPVLLSQPGTLMAIAGDRLFLVPTKKLNTARFVEPLCFEPAQLPILGKGTAAMKVNYKVKGGRGPLKFSLVQEAPGLEINGQSGEVTIDPAKIFTPEKLIAVIDQYVQYSGRMDAAAAGKSITEISATQVKMAEKWSGIKPTGVPVSLKLGVRVRDANQQEALLEHAVLFDMPAEAMQKRMEERLAQTEKVRQQLANGGVVRPGPGPGPGGDDTSALRKRVADLELENAKLKAQVEILKEIRQGGATGKTE